MASSAAVSEALASLFDAHPVSVSVVSGYDETVLYTNGALRKVSRDLGVDPKQLPVDYIGRNARELAELHGLRFEDTALGRAISTGQLQCLQLGERLACASILPLADVSPTAMATVHAGPDCDAAKRDHYVLATRAAIALEFYEAERLVQVGMEALHRARGRMQGLMETLLNTPPLDPTPSTT